MTTTNKVVSLKKTRGQGFGLNAKPRVASSRPRIVPMTVEEFFGLRKCPVQRNTKKRAFSTVKRAHFAKFKDYHAHKDLVSVKCCCDIENRFRQYTDADKEKGLIPEGYDVGDNVVYPKGTIILIDGHTRQYTWKHNMSDVVPENVTLQEYDAYDLDFILELYDVCNAQSDAEKGADKWYGAYTNAGIELSNPKLSNIMAIQWAYRFAFTDIWKELGNQALGRLEFDDAALQFGDALKVLDTVGNGVFTAKKLKGKHKELFDFTAAIQCAAFLAFYYHKVTLNEDGTCDHPVFTFFDNINSKVINLTKDGEWDGVTHVVNEWERDWYISEEGKKFNFDCVDVKIGVDARGNDQFESVDAIHRQTSFVLYCLYKWLRQKKFQHPGRLEKQPWETFVRRYHKTVGGLGSFAGLNASFNVTEC